MAYRVALLGIYHESNTFIDQRTTLNDFRNGHWITGPHIRNEYQSAFHEIGGMIEVLDRDAIELLPVMYAEATPGGIIEQFAYESLLKEMFEKLEEVMPLDGCLVVPHGAAVSEMYSDADGHWLSLLRERLGPEVAILGTLDPHANVSEAMVRATDALVAYKTNPHIDQREAGKTAAELLLRYLYTGKKPVQYLYQLPLAISIELQNSSREPCLALYHYAASLANTPGILSTSIFLGFPYADVPEMGASFIVVSDVKPDAAVSAYEGMIALLNANRQAFSSKGSSIDSQLPLIEFYHKPVLLLDMGDNIGGGSSGRSTFILHAIETYGAYKSFTCICDLEAVITASKYEPGEPFSLSFGRLYENAGSPFTTTVSLLKIVDGIFYESTPRHGGQVHFNMGKTAIIKTMRGNTVMLTSLRMPPFSLSQLTTFGIFPGDFDIVVAKGVNAPVAAYEPFCQTIIQVDTPGVTAADMTRFVYKNRRKPLFPFETEVDVWLAT